MDITSNTTVTITLTRNEAWAIILELSEIDALKDPRDGGPLNTETGLATIRAIRDTLNSAQLDLFQHEPQNNWITRVAGPANA